MKQGPPAHPLGQLIDNSKAVEGPPAWSDVDLARRAAQHGHPISKSNISRLRVTKIRSMSVDLVEQLKAATQRPADQIIAAFVESMGYNLRASSRPTVLDAIDADDRLSADDRETLSVLYRNMVKRNKSVHRGASEIDGDGGRGGKLGSPNVENPSDRAELDRDVYLHRDSPVKKGDSNGEVVSEDPQQV